MIRQAIRPSHGPNDVLDKRLCVNVSGWRCSQKSAGAVKCTVARQSNDGDTYANISSTSSFVTLM